MFSSSLSVITILSRSNSYISRDSTLYKQLILVAIYYASVIVAYFLHFKHIEHSLLSTESNDARVSLLMNVESHNRPLINTGSPNSYITKDCFQLCEIRLDTLGCFCVKLGCHNSAAVLQFLKFQAAKYFFHK